MRTAATSSAWRSVVSRPCCRWLARDTSFTHAGGRAGSVGAVDFQPWPRSSGQKGAAIPAQDRLRPGVRARVRQLEERIEVLYGELYAKRAATASDGER